MELLLHLVDLACDPAIEDENHNQFLHVRHRDVQMASEEGQLHSLIRLHKVNEILCAEASQNVLNVRADEIVIHDGGMIVGQDLFCLMYLASLVCTYEICHGDDLWVILVAANESQTPYLIVPFPLTALSPGYQKD